MTSSHTDQIDYSQCRLLAIHAHPDDESSKGAATMAKYRALGARVKVLTLTGGERGDILNPHFQYDPAVSIGDIRVQEMAQAQKILDIEHEFLGYIDSGLPSEGESVPAESFAAQDPTEVAAKIIAAIREFRPHVILSYDPNGGYPHPDHIQTHKAALIAYQSSGDIELFPGEEPWKISKFYYFSSFNKEYVDAIVHAMHEVGLRHPIEDYLERESGDAENPSDKFTTNWPITTNIHSADFFPIRYEALKAHASQIDPAGVFLSCPVEIEQAAWPYENYHLAYSRVPITDDETDLFAGIDPTIDSSLL